MIPSPPRSRAGKNPAPALMTALIGETGLGETGGVRCRCCCVQQGLPIPLYVVDNRHVFSSLALKCRQSLHYVPYRTLCRNPNVCSNLKMPIWPSRPFALDSDPKHVTLESLKNGPVDPC